MTPRERILKVLNHKIPDRVPYSFKICSHLIDLCEKKMGMRDYTIAFDFDIRRSDPLPTQKQTNFGQFHDHVPENAAFTEWGLMLVPFPNDINYRRHIPSMTNFNSIEQIESYPFPDVDADYRYVNLRKEMDEIKKAGYACCTAINLGPIQTMWSLRGIDRFMMDAAMDDSFTHALYDKVVDIMCRQAKQLALSHPDIILNGDNFATQSGLMVSRRFWRDWYGCAHQRLIEAIKSVDKNIKYAYHADGMMQEMIPDMIEIGIDIFDPIQPECIDPAKIKKEYGEQIVLSGTVGIQHTMPFGTAKDIENEVKLRIKTAGHNGGLLIAPSHTLPPEVPWDNILAFVNAAQTHGKYD